MRLPVVPLWPRALPTLVAACLIAAGCSVTSSEPAPASPSPSQQGGANADDGRISWLLVQTAPSGTFDGEHLTLHRVPPTLLFSDRPERLYGHVDTETLITDVTEGGDSFEEDPPNAVLSTFAGDGPPTVATVTLRDPKMDGDSVSYTVEVLEGTIEPEFRGASLFIDEWYRPYGPFPHYPRWRGDKIIARAALRRARRPESVIVTQPSHAYTLPPPQVVIDNPHLTTAEKLAELRVMLDRGLITQAEYDQKRQQLLDEM